MPTATIRIPGTQTNIPTWIVIAVGGGVGLWLILGHKTNTAAATITGNSVDVGNLESATIPPVSGPTAPQPPPTKNESTQTLAAAQAEVIRIQTEIQNRKSWLQMIANYFNGQDFPNTTKGNKLSKLSDYQLHKREDSFSAELGALEAQLPQAVAQLKALQAGATPGPVSPSAPTAIAL